MAEVNPEQDPFSSEFDAPKEVPVEQSAEVREMTPSFQNVDKRKYFDLIKYKPHGRQWLFHESTARFKIPVCGRRFGKAVEISTLIPTPYGMQKMEHLQVGDQVFDEDGKICNIIAVSNVELEEAFEVIFDDGSVIVTHGNHEWLTWDKKARRTRNLHTLDRRRNIVDPEIRTTTEIAETLQCGKEVNHAVQLALPVEYPKRDLPIDPYLFGIWLGDGTTSDGTITISNQDEWIVEKLKERGHELYVSTSTHMKGCKLWRVSGLRVELRNNFLLGDKRVPVEYLYGSIEQREDLLHGLMDSDGSVANNHVDFDNTNKNLADAVDYLICSLGGRITRSQRIGKLYGVEKKLCYRVHTGNIVDVFSLPRKLKAQRALPNRTDYYRFIKEVKPIGLRQVKCIQVDSPSNLYLVGRRFIPTHNSMMVGKDVQTTLLIPNKRIWIVGPTYDLGEKEFRVVWDDMIVKLGFGREPKIKKSYNKKQGNMFIEFPWNTRIEVRSAERSDTLVGESLDYVIMSEAAKHSQDTWDRYIFPSLSDKRGGAVFGTTPEGMNWLYDLWQYGQNPDYPMFESWRYPSWENEHIYPGGREDSEIKLLERTMPSEEFQQEIAALFTSFSGRIYSEFDEKTHVGKCPYTLNGKCIYNPEWPNYLAFDWGFVNPLAAIEFQIDPQQRVHVWREHYKSRIILDDHLEILRNREQPPGYKIDLCFGDAADPNAIETVNAKFSACWGDPKSKDIWMEGVQLVKGFLKTQQIGEDEYGAPIEQPWLFVDHSCLNLIREFNNYRSPPKKSVRGVETSPREAAQAFDDHALDALRYGMMHVFRLGANVRLSSAVVMDGLSSGGSDGGFFTSTRSQW